MITTEHINELKIKNRGELYKLLREQKDNGKILFLLEHLGRLPSGFNGECFISLLQNKDDRIRLLAVKNIGKLSNDYYLKTVYGFAREDQNSQIRREAVSTIGRMHSYKAIPFLLEMLSDSDPKVLLQAIRALLVFRSNPTVQGALKKLMTHPNEMIQSVIQKEFFYNKSLSISKEKHRESPGFMKNVVVYGDVIGILKYVPDESVHLTFTSPPYYNARDYSIYQSYGEYVEFLADVFKEVHRITKEGRFFLLNTSPIIIPRFSRQHSSKRYPIPFDIHPHLIQMGWEFIDDIVWVKPEETVKNRNAGFLQHRKPLAYKPNPVTEYVMVYRKKTDKLIDWAMRQYDWDTVKQSKVLEEYETSNVWAIDPVFDKVHSAVFPKELCNRVIKLYSYKGDLIFDPFAGSGTLGKAAIDLDRYFFLTEKERKYIERIRQEIGNKSLFDKTESHILHIEEFRKLAKGENR
ncbi:MAG TPA: restriction endonuclease subunit M [Dehalococcoidia bacterium]|nr:restriction endonuclease subunit M [Dehalococcoidia bacterium]